MQAWIFNFIGWNMTQTDVCLRGNSLNLTKKRVCWIAMCLSVNEISQTFYCYEKHSIYGGAERHKLLINDKNSFAHFQPPVTRVEW